MSVRHPDRRGRGSLLTVVCLAACLWLGSIRAETRRRTELYVPTRDVEERIEALLDAYFTATSEAERGEVLEQLEQTRLKGRRPDLQLMRTVAAGGKHSFRHEPVPWRRGTKRGWYNLTIPKDYNPETSWPLVIALHGMPSDGDNLVPIYDRYFPQRGYIVLYPTTLHAASSWPAPDEKRELLRLLQHVCRRYRIDYRRIYCTGASGGGIGTWHWLVTEPRLFAAGVAFSAAGTIFDQRLKAIKGTPFYVHHGSLDPISVRSTRASVQLARKHGVTIEFHLSEGTGHDPPRADWERGFKWLTRQPPNPVYARFLLERQVGTLPLGYPKYKPFAGVFDAAELKRAVAAHRVQPDRWLFPAEAPKGTFVSRCVAVARIVDPDASVEPVIDAVAGIAADVGVRFKAGMSREQKLYELNRVFFGRYGFGPDPLDPYLCRPEATLMPLVIKTKRGNSFGLTALYCVVAHALDLPVFPVVTPYHAFARYDDGKLQVNIEMTEAGTRFSDSIYIVGYGLQKIDDRRTLYRRSAGNLIAAQITALARGACRAGNKLKALEGVRAARLAAADCYPADVLEGRLLVSGNEPAKALEVLERAAKRWPRYAEAPYRAAEIQLKRGKTAAAEELFGQSTKAPILPVVNGRQFRAQTYFRIAELHYDAALKYKRGESYEVISYNRCGRALRACLQLRPTHLKARVMWVHLDGRTRVRPRESSGIPL